MVNTLRTRYETQLKSCNSVSTDTVIHLISVTVDKQNGILFCALVPRRQKGKPKDEDLLLNVNR